MSRYVKKVNDKVTIAYGWDHAIGYFFQKFNDDLISDENEEGIEIDEDSLFHKLSNSKFVEYLMKYECKQEHINAVLMDLEF